MLTGQNHGCAKAMFSDAGWIATTALVRGIPDARKILLSGHSPGLGTSKLSSFLIPHRTLGVSTTCISDIHRLLYVAIEKYDCPASYMDPNINIHL